MKKTPFVIVAPAGAVLGAQPADTPFHVLVQNRADPIVMLEC
jgi:hypothetical protein